MKKFLSLVLALIMTMSLVTISAGAKGFTDADEVNYDEAIDVLSALKVVEGYPDESFKPAKTLTRAEAAKIICNMILGPTTAAALSASAAPFSDVAADNWAAGYITYCAQQGIISGYGNGAFGPTDTLTGYQFMKMLLGALGYDADIEGYNNPGSFGIQVAKQAIGIGLNKGLKDTFDGNKTVTREEACLYALNTLKATMVEYDQKIIANVNGAQITVGTSLAKEVKWNIAEKKNDGNIKADQYVQFAEKYFPNLELETGNGMYGRPTNVWKLKKSEIGAFASIEPTYVYTESTDGDDVYKDLGKVVCDEKEYDWSAYVNGAPVAAKDVEVPTKDNDDEWAYTGEGTVTEIYVDDDENTVTVCEINYYLGQVTKVKSDDDGEYITVSVLSKGAKGLDDKTFYVEGYEQDDYVVFTMDWNDDDKEFDIGEVCEPETVTAEVTRVEKDTSASVTNGKTGETYLRTSDGKYTYTEDVTAPAQQSHIVYDLDDLAAGKKHPTLNTEYVIFLDPNGYVLGFKVAEETVDQYLYVDDADEEMRDWLAKVYLADATNPKIDVDKDLVGVPTAAGHFLWPDGTTTTNAGKAPFGTGDVEWTDRATGEAPVNTKNATNIEGMIWKYSVDKNNVYELTYVPVSANALDGESQYALATWDDQNKAWTAEIKNGRSYVTDGHNTFIVDKKTVFVDVDGGNVYTGYAEVPNVEHAKLAYVLDGKTAEVVFILEGEIYDEGNVYFMLSSDSRNSFKYDGKSFWQYEKAVVNGEKAKLNVKYGADPESTNTVLAEAPALYQVKKTIDEEYITEVKQIDLDAKSYPVEEVAVDAFWINNTNNSGSNQWKNKFDVDEETVFVVVDMKTDGKKVDAIYSGNIDDMDDNDYETEVAVLEQDDQTAELVYIVRTPKVEKATVTFTGTENYAWVTVGGEHQDTHTFQVTVGDDFAFGIDPIPGLAVKSVKVDGKALTAVDGVYTLKKVSAKTEVVVEFDEVLEVTIKTNASEYAMVSVNGADPVEIDSTGEKFEVAKGGSLTVEVTASSKPVDDATMSTLTARLYRSDDTFTLTNITVAGDLIIELAD